MPVSTAAGRLQEPSRVHFNSKNANSRNLTHINPTNTKKSPIHENTNAKITCYFGDERFRIAAARLEHDIFVRTHMHTARIVVRIYVSVRVFLLFTYPLFLVVFPRCYVAAS